MKYQAYSYSWGGLKKIGPVIGRYRGKRWRLARGAIFGEADLENAKACLRECTEAIPLNSGQIMGMDYGPA